MISGIYTEFRILPLHLQLTGTALDGSLPAVTVTHYQSMTAFVPFALMAADIFIYFSL